MLGAQEVLRVDDPAAVVNQVNEWTEGRGCERVVEATGMAGPLTMAGEVSAVGGRLIIAGYHQDGPREVNM